MPQIGVVDLLASEPVVVGAEGLTGPYGSATIPLTADLDGGFTVALAGDVVLAGGGSRTFTAAVASALEVDGVPCAVTVDGGSMDVSIALGELVRRIDFAGAAEVDGVDPIDLAAVAQAKNAIERELAAQSTYSLTYTKGP